MAETQGLVRALGNSLPVILPTVAVLAVVYLVQLFLAGSSLSHIPEIGSELGSNEKRRQAFLFNAKGLYQDGYQKVRLVT